MGIFDDDFLKEMFDFNNDGELDFSEKLYRDAFFVNEILPAEEQQKIKSDSIFYKTKDD